MGEQFQIDMNDFLPLRDVVFNTLRKAILTGQLKPGERLMEVHLANQLGVSRTPIREGGERKWPESPKRVYGMCWRCDVHWMP